MLLRAYPLSETAFILIGQYDSPFVRRVGIALVLYDLPFEHRPWSVFGDVEKIRTFNPLTRVPTLVLDNGESLIDSHCIVEYLDSLVPEEQRMFPTKQPDRYRSMRIAAMAAGVGDKAVSLVYELRLHNDVSDVWVKRCSDQIASTLAVMDAERAAQPADYWFGPRIGHADIVVATVLRFISEVHPDRISMAQFPALAAHCVRLEALPAFKTISQPFNAPA